MRPLPLEDRCVCIYILGSTSFCVLVYFFFFFQAEDGIRDLTVTGVQTCALPISAHLRAWLWRAECDPRTSRSDAPGGQLVGRPDARHARRGQRRRLAVDAVDRKSVV